VEDIFTKSVVGDLFDKHSEDLNWKAEDMKKVQRDDCDNRKGARGCRQHPVEVPSRAKARPTEI